jgi:hypothetical protein
LVFYILSFRFSVLVTASKFLYGLLSALPSSGISGTIFLLNCYSPCPADKHFTVLLWPPHSSPPEVAILHISGAFDQQLLE